MSIILKNKQKIQNSIYDTLEKLGYDVDNKLKDIVKLDVYNFDNIDLKTSIGSYYDIAKDKYPLMPYNKKESIVKISDYNKIAKLFGLKEYTLNDDEYLLLLIIQNMQNSGMRDLRHIQYLI